MADDGLVEALQDAKRRRRFQINESPGSTTEGITAQDIIEDLQHTKPIFDSGVKVPPSSYSASTFVKKPKKASPLREETVWTEKDRVFCRKPFGGEKWSFPNGDEYRITDLFPQVVMDNKQLYVVANGQLVAINRDNGHFLWGVPESSLARKVILTGGIVGLITHNNKVSGFSQSGEEEFYVECGEPIGSMFKEGDDIYLGGIGKIVYMGLEGAEMTRFKARGFVTELIKEGNILFALGSEGVVGIDMETGKRKLSKRGKFGVIAADPNRVFLSYEKQVGLLERFLRLPLRGVVSYPLDQRGSKWVNEMVGEDGFPTVILPSGSKVYVGAGRSIYCMSTGSGLIEWRTRLTTTPYQITEETDQLVIRTSDQGREAMLDSYHGGIEFVDKINGRLL